VLRVISAPDETSLGNIRHLLLLLLLVVLVLVLVLVVVLCQTGPQ